MPALETGLAVPDSWPRDRWKAEIRQTRKRKRNNIQPHVAIHSTTSGNALGTISHSWRKPTSQNGVTGPDARCVGYIVSWCNYNAEPQAERNRSNEEGTIFGFRCPFAMGGPKAHVKLTTTRAA